MSRVTQQDSRSRILEEGLPASIEAEQFVLGTVLLDNRTLHPITETLAESDWHSERHKHIFLAMLALHRQQAAIDILTLTEQLRSERALDTAGGPPYLAALTAGLPRFANIDSYIRIVKDKSRLRQTIAAAQQIISECIAGDSKSDEVIAAAQASILRIGRSTEPRGLASVAPQPITRWDDSALPKPLLRRQGQDTGAVLSAGEIAILSGAGGKGKSTLALQIALAASGGASNEYRYAAGLEVASGAVVIASYEDQGPVIRHRIRSLADRRQAPSLENIHLSEMAGHPLYGPPETGLYTARPEPQYPDWRVFWDRVGEISPSIVIIDPVAAAFSSEANRIEAVRQFMDALRLEAKRAACGILLIAHSTKAERSRYRAEGGAPDAGAVAGSAAWHDACRGVLTLDSRKSGEFQLHLVKANYGTLWKPISLQRSGHGPFQEAALAGGSQRVNGELREQDAETGSSEADEWDHAPY